jgi:hypothetical protein
MQTEVGHGGKGEKKLQLRYTAEFDSKVTGSVANKRNAVLVASLHKRCNAHHLSHEGDTVSFRHVNNFEWA